MFLFLATLSQAKTWIVDHQSRLKLIREALTAANPGDTILVRAGVYEEGNIIVSKSIVLIGEGYPILDGEFKYEVFTVNASNVTITGFHIR
ncbi:MAG: nitrous oxide reductase family maturation protein NosD, partial [Cyclobacteriaceae bacterium]